jgi:hypothetical protein
MRGYDLDVAPPEHPLQLAGPSGERDPFLVAVAVHRSPAAARLNRYAVLIHKADQRAGPELRKPRRGAGVPALRDAAPNRAFERRAAPQGSINRVEDLEQLS